MNLLPFFCSTDLLLNSKIKVTLLFCLLKDRGRFTKEAVAIQQVGRFSFTCFYVCFWFMSQQVHFVNNVQKSIRTDVILFFAGTWWFYIVDNTTVLFLVITRKLILLNLK